MIDQLARSAARLAHPEARLLSLLDTAPEGVALVLGYLFRQAAVKSQSAELLLDLANGPAEPLHFVLQRLNDTVPAIPAFAAPQFIDRFWFSHFGSLAGERISHRIVCDGRRPQTELIWMRLSVADEHTDHLDGRRVWAWAGVQ